MAEDMEFSGDVDGAVARKNADYRASGMASANAAALVTAAPRA
jgi:hypothetical protein